MYELPRPAIVRLTWMTACLCSSIDAAAENWSQFRGQANGVAEESTLPVEWGPIQHVVWKAAIPGVGWSQPIVWGDKIFVTTAVSNDASKPDPKNTGPGVGGLAGFFATAGVTEFKPPETSYQWKILCLDATSGEVMWEQIAREGRPNHHIHPNNTYASETPVTDGEQVIAYFGMSGLYCYDLGGDLQWSKELSAYPTQFGWGNGSSPVLVGDVVIIQCDNEESSFLAAFDKRTGEERWRAEREEKSNWSTPYVWKNTLRTELITAGGGSMRSYDPQTGDLLWEIAGQGRTSITPVGNDSRVYVDSFDRLTGGRGTLIAIRPGAAGNADSHVAWSVRLDGYRNASPLLYQGCLYVVEQNGGIIHCLDANTGAEHYRKRLPKASGFTSSPLGNNGNVYCLDQKGCTIIVEAGPQLKVRSSNDLNEMCWASPAVYGGRLLIRTLNHLYCIGTE